MTRGPRTSAGDRHSRARPPSPSPPRGSHRSEPTTGTGELVGKANDFSERAEHSSSRSSPSPAKPPRRPCLSPEANRRRLGFRSPGTRRPLEPPRHRIPATALRPQPPAVPLRSPPPDPAAPPRCLQLRVGAGWLGFGFPAAEAEPPPSPTQGLAPEGPSSRSSPHPPPLLVRGPPCSRRPRLLDSVHFPRFAGWPRAMLLVWGFFLPLFSLAPMRGFSCVGVRSKW